MGEEVIWAPAVIKGFIAIFIIALVFIFGCDNSKKNRY